MTIDERVHRLAERMISCGDDKHRSDCALHNEPAMPVEPCNCGIWFDCLRCHGIGRQPEFPELRVDCFACHGDGAFSMAWDGPIGVCGSCSGIGWLPATSALVEKLENIAARHNKVTHIYPPTNPADPWVVWLTPHRDDYGVGSVMGTGASLLEAVLAAVEAAVGLPSC